VLGPSGCGKSTLLKVVAGLLAPSGGSITLEGASITGPRPDVVIVFQQPTLVPWQTVLDNVLLPIRTLGMDEVAGRKRALELLELVGLAKFASHYPNELSGGMQQRVGIARGIIHDPKLLLMDEPFAALDAMSREHMSYNVFGWPLKNQWCLSPTPFQKRCFFPIALWCYPNDPAVPYVKSVWIYRDLATSTPWPHPLLQVTPMNCALFLVRLAPHRISDDTQ